MNEAVRAFLDEQRICPGASLAVAATAEDSLLVRVGEAHVSLTRALAEAVQVGVEASPEAAAVTPIRSDKGVGMQNRFTRVSLHELKVGQCGIVVRVGGQGPVRRRMMDMGLVSGAEVKVVRVAPWATPSSLRSRDTGSACARARRAMSPSR